MAFQKGHKKVGGRKEGTPNQVTADAREAIKLFVDGNAHLVQGWLDEIAAEHGPRAAFDCWLQLVEFHVPKLNRTTLSNDPDNPLPTPQWVMPKPRPK